MSTRLLPCPECRRHVWQTETRCPFCAAALESERQRRPGPSPPERISRAAQLLWGILLAACATPREPSRGVTRNYVDPRASPMASRGGAPPTEPVQKLAVPTDAGAESEPDVRSGVVAIYGAAMTVTEAVRFEPNKAELDAASATTLNAVGELLRARPDFVIEIRGHADKRERGPQALSERRARLVFDWLIRHDVKSEQLRLLGRGADVPVFGDDGWQKNARVEFVPLVWDERD